MNSATEISTDSEFERDPIAPQLNTSGDNNRKASRIQVNNQSISHFSLFLLLFLFLLQVKQGMIENSVHRAATTVKASSTQKPKNNIRLEFEPLVRVDPTVMPANREPLQNPRVGDYLLKQTASTEGIASKKSLELKKRYLLGDAGLSSGIMKSDSMSMLDSKFKNFRSTISDCQKLLNPPVSDNNSMQKVSDAVNIKPSSIVANQDFVEEKENVYDQIVSTRNEINKTDLLPEPVKTGKSSENCEKQTNILIENKLRDSSIKLIDEEQSVKKSLTAVNSPNTTAASNLEGFDMKKVEKRNSLELTNELRIIESVDNSRENVTVRSLENKVDDYKPVYENRKESESNYFPSSKLPTERSKNQSSEIVVKKDDESIEPLLNMPYIVWAQAKNQKRPDSDTFSSSTSSPAEIPHFILESTTSPDTQATPCEQTPIDNKHDDLMQMDSLMLIDGKYIGDPEDLKHIKMPENFDSNSTSITTITTMTTTSNPVSKTIIHVPSSENVLEMSKEEMVQNKAEPVKSEQRIFKYEPIYKRPIFRFDTKNENKIDTLKNIPLILQNDEKDEKPLKPNQLNLSSNAIGLVESPDNDKTPTVSNPGNLLDYQRSDSETEITGQALTETELSDWTADDAVSENFVDVEFALNSKDTIKRNKKSNKKKASSSTTSHSGQAPIATNLDFDELEFMDTGSEDSYVETYAATNKAMLNNRGYVQFVNTHSDAPINHYNHKKVLNQKPTRIELADRSKDLRQNYYIEQGALLLSNDGDLKTPMNENPASVSPKEKFDRHQDSQPEVDDDSIVFITSQGGNTTTEESDALTVVTSPMESAPKYDESSSTSPNRKSSSTTIESTSKKHSPSLQQQYEDNSKLNRKNSDEITYEDYVRQLQMKITQISNARDSIDIRKTKRKHSRTDASNDNSINNQTQHRHQSQIHPQQQEQQSQSSVIDNNNKSLSIYVGKNEPATVVEKIEEITKERMKQKDLIHDLVMDKLQSKKQSNAEKRLSRSRNRSSALNISPNTSILPPVSIVSTSSSSLAHSQSVTNMSSKYSYQSIEPERRHCLPNQSNALSLSPTKELSTVNQSNRKLGQRPRSANVEEFPIFETPKLSKTQSFCVHTNRDAGSSNHSHGRNSANDFQYRFSDSVNVFSTPVIPRRRKIDDELTQTTEKLRQDARHRARLKSNQDLGLSPEEKIALLRKRYNLENSMTTASAVPCSTYTVATPNKSDDMKVRERKMTTSKSVNDITANPTTLTECNPLGIGSHRKLNDFTSNPNLGEGKPSPKRRVKDPERRKSIIQAVSDFFHKKRDKDASAAPKEKSEGMFGRLRISPKSKSKVSFPSNI